MSALFKRIFGTAQTRKVKQYQKIVHKINAFEESLKSLSDDELRSKTAEFQTRFANGESLDSMLPEAFAVVKDTCRRLVGTEIHVSGYNQKWDMIPYDVQLVGGIAMHFGTIAEMMTGEGKTLTASLPLYLRAMTKKPVHLVTVNDYLATRDCEWIGTIFKWLGLKVSALTNDTPVEDRASVYKSDIVYGTASEFGFDYLRDNSMAQVKDELVQRGHYFAIIDEVDSILIDEARTPLIISGPMASSNQMYDELKGSVDSIVKLQNNYCNKLASDAQKKLQELGLFKSSEEAVVIPKDKQKEVDNIFRTLWLLGKGTPKHKTLKRIKENPDLRAKLEEWETNFYSDQNKEEKLKLQADLYMLVDEKASDYELTDKGIDAWAKASPETQSDDFVMIDLGGEYAKIDSNPELSEKEKLDKKIAARQLDAVRKERAHNVRQLFRAHLLMEKDIDYIVQDNKVVIIDENTGRPQPGRRFSDGLHQSIEAKEGLSIQSESQTYATITLQNYFRMYDALAGMTGTAMTEAGEFMEIYKIDVLDIPTHRKCQRIDHDDVVYMTEREKYNAILKELQTEHEKGRPILIGTESVEVSEKLSRILKGAKMPHTILNAKNHAKEAEIIAAAGKRGAITVATNMAGRGTDIKLEQGVNELGGLLVIGTTRHHSRRIDRQLRGRSARQGDPGASKFFVSFEDSLMRLFASPKITAILQRFRPEEGEAISASILNKSIETAQKRIEQRNYSMRKHTLEYDDVMNKQRQEAYAFRSTILHEEDPLLIAYDVLEGLVSQKAALYLASRDTDGGWNPLGFRDWLNEHFPITFPQEVFESDHQSGEELEQKITSAIMSAFKKKLEVEAQLIAAIQEMSKREVAPLSVLRGVVSNLLIKSFDSFWQEHLLAIDNLRTEVSMRVVGQKDPLMEFKHEAFALFDRFSVNLKTEIAHALFGFEMVLPQTDEIKQTIERLQAKKSPSKTFIID
ncbi:MAG: preprotein translocase subunit SecA [Rhabdochlamydiaceae bacterium]|nr:preprotein translocase subunit SecA [Candidatus Amphrikana amoebophyrae]